MRLTATAELIELANIPEDLVDLPQWVNWSWELRDGKRTKVPKQANGINAKADDHTTWTSFNEVTAALNELDGIGFVVTEDDPFCGIDIDHCRDANTGELQSWAATIVDRCASYTEVTPSLTGIRIWICGKKPGANCKKSLPSGAAIEIYDRFRFFTLTGMRLGSAATINERQKDLNVLYSALFPPTERSSPVRTVAVSASDRELAEKMFSAKNGVAIRRLFDGDPAGYGSQSEADLALVSHLWFWTGGDASRTDALFRQSGLMRPKWDDRRGDHSYGQETIRRVANG